MKEHLASTSNENRAGTINATTTTCRLCNEQIYLAGDKGGKLYGYCPRCETTTDYNPEIDRLRSINAELRTTLDSLVADCDNLDAKGNAMVRDLHGWAAIELAKELLERSIK